MLTVAQIKDAFNTLSAENEVIGFDFDAFDKVVTDLISERASMRADAKTKAKKAKDAENAELGKVAKEYYDSLNEGDVFSYKDASGKIWEAKKIVPKSGSDKRASCELIDPPAGAKSTKRYPEFFRVVVPTEE
jgi:hypothetical protein